MTNKLYFGDNLHVPREHIADESVDLVYLDPPFNSNANYNILFKSPEGADSDAQIEAFLARTQDAVAEPLDDAFGQVDGAGRQRLPGDAGRDGFFLARLRKRARPHGA